MGLVVGFGGVFDDKASLEPGHGGGKTGGFDAAEHFWEVLVGVRRFVDRIGPAVSEDVRGVELRVDRLLVECPRGMFASHLASGTVIDRPCGFLRTGLGHHDH